MSAFVLIGGGVRSGKSAFALELARARGPRRAFVATAQAIDEEMEARVRRHQAERADAFTTFEAPKNLEATILEAARTHDVVVVDCLTLWLSNLLLDDLTAEHIAERVDRLADTLRASPVSTILVTNEVGMGIVPESALGRLFRDVAGFAHQRLARDADEIFLAVLGAVLRIHPGPLERVVLEGSKVRGVAST